MTQAVAKNNLPGIATVIATAAIFGLTYSLSAALIALDLAELNMSEAVIGANASMHAVGVLIMAFFLPRITAALGIRRAVVFSLLTVAALLVAFPALPFVWLWFVLRVLLGGASEALFVLSETWLNALSSEKTRSRAMGAYTAALSVGFALGPLILSFVGSDGFAPYLVGTGLTVAAALMALSPKTEAPVIEKPAHNNPARYIRLAPLALAATTLNAAVETAGLTFLTLYAISIGWQEAQATQLMSWMMFGAILLQFPIGWIGDKTDRKKLVVILAGISAIGALVWPLALENQWATYGVLFVWGGAVVGLYTIMLSIVGSKFKGGELVGIYAAMGLLWGAGAFIGPAAAGAAMEISPHGLAYFTAGACALFMVMAMRIKTREGSSETKKEAVGTAD